jgi:PAS domain S-box-containing protein
MGRSLRAEDRRTLHEAEARFRVAFESAPIGMALCDLDGRFLQVNPALCRIVGRSEEELLASTWQDVTHPDDHQIQEAFERDAVTGHQPSYEIEKRYIRPDGTEVWTHVAHSVVAAPGGEPLYLVSQTVDLTDLLRVQDELRRQKEELAALHETTLDLIRRLEPTSLLEAILARAANLMGTEHAYLYVINEPAGELEVRAGTGMFAGYLGYRMRRGEGLAGKVWETGQAVAVEDYQAWAAHRPGFKFIRAAVALPLRAGPDIVGVLGLVHIEEGRTFSDEEVDLLSRFGRLASLALDNARLYSSAQQELRERRRAEKELERAAEELRLANEELRAADEVKSNFVAVASHELRTPLTSVLGFATTLLTHWERIPDEEKRAQLELIEGQARKLAQMAEELLTMSKLEAGALEIHPEPLDVSHAVDQTLSSFAEHARDIEVVQPDGLRAYADPQHVLHILSNYVANALKYGRPPVRIEARERQGSVEILVSDRGPGVPPHFVPRLFEKFAQAQTTEGGTGLGLSIVRGLARAQGGEAWYEPADPQGAAFGLRLPVSA